MQIGRITQLTNSSSFDNNSYNIKKWHNIAPKIRKRLVEEVPGVDWLCQEGKDLIEQIILDEVNKVLMLSR